MNQAFATIDPTQPGAFGRWKWTKLPRPFDTWVTAMGGTEVKALGIIGEEASMARPAQPHRLFDDRVEHRREVTGRRVYYTKHLSGRGLLLQCLARLGDQPRVLHRNHRLCGEVFDQS